MKMILKSKALLFLIILSLCTTISAQRKYFTDKKSLENQLSHFNQATKEDLEKDSVLTEKTIATIKESLESHDKGDVTLEPIEVKKMISHAISDGARRKVLTYTVDQEVLKKDFLHAISHDNSKKALALLKKDSYLASIKDPITGDTPLLLTIKNYSGLASEEALIAKILIIQPQQVFIKNNYKKDIFAEIATFEQEYKERLLRLVKATLAKKKISKELEQQFTVALNNNAYELAISLFMQFPQLANFKSSNGNTLLDYIEQAGGRLDEIKAWVEKIKQ